MQNVYKMYTFGFGMPVLQWIGKEKVVSHHHDVPFRVLEHSYGFSEGKEQKTSTDSGNKIIHGDNLEALKSLLPEYEGKIKCIYIDPPYNTGKENWVYNDNVSHPKIKKWLHEIVGREGEDLTRHDKWLCMMYPRLKLLQKLLSKDGVIIISIDDNEQANLKLIMDEIFGIKNLLLQGVINKASEIASAYTISKHEYFTVYAKSIDQFSISGSEKVTISRGTVGNEKQTMPVIEFPAGLKVLNLNDGVYKESRKIQGSNENIENLDPFVVQDGFLAKEVRLKARWRSSNDMRNFFQSGCQPTKAKINGIIEEIYFDGDRLMPYIKKQTSEKISSIYTENKRGSLDLERLGMNNVFENPKAESFIENILCIVTDQNSIILDSFAGSGTTAHAVLNLNKQDEGNRKFILIEMEEYANSITAERVKRVIKGYGDTEGTGGSFDFYELGKPVFTGDNREFLNEEVDDEKIREYIWYSETRSPYHPPEEGKDTKYFLGKKEETAYYFFYEKKQLTTLDYELLSQIKTRSGQYIIYADNCLLPQEFMMQHHIIFKKIPRDITRF